jgi:hypothetical protein
MGFFSGLIKKTPVETGPRIAGRSEFGGEFVIAPNEAMVLEDTIVTNMGAGNGVLTLGLKVGDRTGRLEIPFNQSSAPKPWYEYNISAVSLDNMNNARIKVGRVCRDAKPVTYDSDFWLKSGEAAVFEHGFVVRNKSVSKSRMGEFTNVSLELSQHNQKKEVTLVTFAKGKEKFVFADSKKSATFGQFEVRLANASDTDAVLSVRHLNSGFL